MAGRSLACWLLHSHLFSHPPVERARKRAKKQPASQLGGLRAQEEALKMFEASCRPTGILISSNVALDFCLPDIRREQQQQQQQQLLLQLQLQQRQARKFQLPEPREISELRPSIWMKEASKFDFPASLLLSAAPDTPTSDAARQFGAARGNFLFFSLPGNSIWLATRTEAPSS